jgi:protein-tyrosine phosphatase
MSQIVRYDAARFLLPTARLKGAAVSSATPVNRYLRWPSCLNVRDLGGFETAEGVPTRWRAFVRADTLSGLTDRGRAALEAYGIRTIIDLRNPVEVRDDPGPFAAHDSIAWHNHPLDPNGRDVSKAVSVHRGAGLTTMVAVNAALLDVSRTQVATIMRTIATAPEGGVLFHCHAGRDRTGLIAALLLGLVGVPADAIVEDYARSYNAMASTMAQTLTHIEETYGGVAGYLCTIGMTEAEIALLRQRLRDDGASETAESVAEAVAAPND